MLEAYCLSGASEVMDCREEPTTSTFLGQYNTYLHAKCLSLYPQTSRASVKKLLFSTAGDRQRKLQVVKMQRKNNSGVSSSSGYIYNTTHASMAQG